MYLIQLLANILPVIAIVSIITVIGVNFISSLTKRYPRSVNCWFCNGNTLVSYEQHNSFVCPHCEQYNGFDEDGGYNKVILEQHDELFNSKVSPAKRKTISKPVNGLCRICNNNQQLKVYQLASFVPLSDANYDVEIEHFRSLLERAYKLCPKCYKVLKDTLRQQSKMILGRKILSIQKQGLKMLNLSVSTGNVSKQAKRSLFNSLIYYSIILTAIIVILDPLINSGITLHEFNRYVPEVMHPMLFSSTKSLLSTQNLIEDYYDVLQLHPEYMFLKDYVNTTLLIPSVVFAGQLRSMWEQISEHATYIPAFTASELKTDSDTAIIAYGLLLQFSAMFLRKRNVDMIVLWLALFIPKIVTAHLHFSQLLEISCKTLIGLLIICKAYRRKNIYVNASKVRKAMKNGSKLNDSVIEKDAASSSDSISDVSTSSERSDDSMNMASVSHQSHQFDDDATICKKATTRLVFGKVNSSALFAESSTNVVTQQQFAQQRSKAATSLANTAFCSYRTAPDWLPDELENGNSSTSTIIPNVFRTKSILSPPRLVLCNTQPQPIFNCRTSMFAMKGPADMPSRCSSQTSGFESTHNLATFGNFSANSSAHSSVSGDFDSVSMVGEQIGRFAFSNGRAQTFVGSSQSENFNSSMLSVASAPLNLHSGLLERRKVMGTDSERLNASFIHVGGQRKNRGLFKMHVYNNNMEPQMLATDKLVVDGMDI